MDNFRKTKEMGQIEHDLSLNKTNLKKIGISETCFILVLQANYHLTIKKVTVVLTHSVKPAHPLYFATAISLPNKNTFNQIHFSPWNRPLLLNKNDFLILIFNIPDNNTPASWNIS